MVKITCKCGATISVEGGSAFEATRQMEFLEFHDQCNKSKTMTEIMDKVAYRRMFAQTIMGGLSVSNHLQVDDENRISLDHAKLAHYAVQCADALIEALEIP